MYLLKVGHEDKYDIFEFWLALHEGFIQVMAHNEDAGEAEVWNG